MIYTEQDKKVARGLVENQEFLDLLKKVFLNKQDKISSDLVIQRTDEQLGQIVRADSMAEDKVKARFDRLKILGSSKERKGTKVPR